MKAVTLAGDHYASSWVNDVRKTAEVNAIGLVYARMPDGPEKEAKLLELCQCFHQYLMKYLSMICRGHVPTWGSNTKNGWTNSDVKGFLFYFMPKGERLNKPTCIKICKHLHLAFKGKSTEEIYDVLMEQLLRAIRLYDPEYSEKTRQVVEIINGKLSRFRQITPIDINRHLEFDCTGHLRMLTKRKHLETIVEKGRTCAYVRANWPPDATIYRHPVGITYCIQKWFRLYLHQWITSSMCELESKEGVYSLDFRPPAFDESFDHRSPGSYFLTSLHGQDKRTNEPIDTSMVRRPLDVSSMSLAWVNGTEDSLFADLSKGERRLLYLVFAQDFDMRQLAAALNVEVEVAKNMLEEVLIKVRSWTTPKVA